MFPRAADFGLWLNRKRGNGEKRKIVSCAADSGPEPNHWHLVQPRDQAGATRQARRSIFGDFFLATLYNPPNCDTFVAMINKKCKKASSKRFG